MGISVRGLLAVSKFGQLLESSSLNKISGNTGNTEIFPYKEIRNRVCHLWEQFQVAWEPCLGYHMFGNVLLQAIPPLSHYMSYCGWYSLALVDGSEMMQQSQWLTGKPPLHVFSKSLTPHLRLAGKLPFSSSWKKYPSKPIQFLKLWPLKFLRPYHSYPFIFHTKVIQFRKEQIIACVLFSNLAHS